MFVMSCAISFGDCSGPLSGVVTGVNRLSFSVCLVRFIMVRVVIGGDLFFI